MSWWKVGSRTELPIRGTLVISNAGSVIMMSQGRSVEPVRPSVVLTPSEVQIQSTWWRSGQSP